MSSDPSPPNMNRQHDSPDESIKDNSGAIAKAVLNDRTGLYLAIIAILFGAMAFGMSIVLPMVYSERMEAMRDRVEIAERNTALAREDVRIMQNALAARGIQTDIHEEQRK